MTLLFFCTRGVSFSLIGQSGSSSVEEQGGGRYGSGGGQLLESVAYGFIWCRGTCHTMALVVGWSSSKLNLVSS